MKKTLISAFRIGLCAAALWYVLHGVSMKDRVLVSTDTAVGFASPETPTASAEAQRSTMLTGTILDHGAVLDVMLADGTVRTIGRTDILLDEHGAEQLSYGLASAWRNSSKWLLVLSLVIFSAVPVFQAVRFRWMLQAHGIALTFWESYKLALTGNFLNFAAPLGSTAGDVFKAYYAAQHTPRKTEAATTVFVDRAVGLATLVVSVCLIAILFAGDSRLSPLRGYLAVLMGGLILGAVLYASPMARQWPPVRKLAARLPMAGRLTRIDQTALTLMRCPRTLLGAMGITFILQLFAAASFVAVALALGMNITGTRLPAVYAYFSTGEIIKAIPGPPQGLGTMELAYSYFFSAMGSASQIVSAAFAIRLVNLVCALPGAAVACMGACRPRATAPQEQPELAMAVSA